MIYDLDGEVLERLSFDTLVACHLDVGWVCVGGVSVSTNPESGACRYSQAMRR